MSPATKQRNDRAFARAAWVVLGCLAVPLWLTVLILVLLLFLLETVALYVLVWLWWIGPRQRRTLFVYSDSPIWKEYLERTIIPRLPSHSVVLNWSRRRQWGRLKLSSLLFRRFAGNYEFNPIAVVFERFRLAKAYRFWQPFRGLKHGNPEALSHLEEEFWRHLAGGRS